MNKIISKNKYVFAIIVDISILSWALDKAENVSYAIGAAANVLGNNNFLPNSSDKRTIFTMNSLINVLTPQEAIDTLRATVKRMCLGDRLAITNLDRMQFQGQSHFHESSEGNGMYVISRRRLERGVEVIERYKTAISDDFVIFILKEFPNLKLIEAPQHAKVKCQAPAGPLKTVSMDVQFITVMFECAADFEKDV